MLRHLKWIIPTTLVAALALYVYSTVFGYLGSGYAQLEIEFLVVDATTDQPIEGAEITIASWGGHPQLDEEHHESPVTTTLQTGEDGRARISAGRCFADMSGDAWGSWTLDCVYLPHWRYMVSADGYRKPEWIVGFRPEYLPQEHIVRGMKQVIRWRLAPEPAE